LYHQEGKRLNKQKLHKKSPYIILKITIMTAIEFNTSLNKLSSLLQSFAYNLTKNMEDAKDLFQETSFRALTNRDKFRDGTNFKAWLFTIMKNIFINNYRKKIKSNTIIDGTDNQFYINSMTVSTPNRAESEIMMQELNQMIVELEDNIQVPFVMHYQGFKYQEIADDLQLPLGTVKSRIFFARKELKDKINMRYDNIGKIYEKGSISEELNEPFFG
jgi:RNA polymerase sigma-70 factor, ECF subfamily